MAEATGTAEKLEFKAELKQLLHLITHSLYSHKEIFLRELISNASDAINKLRFDSLAHEERLEGNTDWKIRIVPDRDQGTLTVSDNGIGMSRAEVVENLGTIARSGTRAFLENLKNQEVKDQPGLIGQFGVGFYSAFMVADRVTVVTRPAGSPAEGTRWESDGQGEFSVEAAEKPTRGTDVTLHLKPEDRELLDDHRLREIVRKFSDFIEYPVVIDTWKENDKGEKERGEEVLNARKAIWLRNRSDNTPEEYNEFYKQISGDFTDPVKVVHYNVEGTQEFRALLFVPAHQPLDMHWGEFKWGPRLYVQRVLIMEHCEALLPPYLRFVRGVVDSSDLPLNISREILQQNPLLERMQRNLTRRVLDALGELKDEEYDKYTNFYRELGMVVKEGVARDRDNRDKIVDLLLFESIDKKPGEFITLAQYVEAMPADQKAIYYLAGESREQIEHSPYLEAFRARGQNVLLLSDPVDEFWPQALGEYRGKRLQPVDQGELDQDKEEKAKQEEAGAAFKPLLDALKAKLPEVSDVRLSSRLRASAACLVAGQGGVTAHLERLMQRMGHADQLGPAKRALELNGEHPVVQALKNLFDREPQDPRLEDYARLLYDEAVLAEGSRVKDPAAFARRINDLIVKNAGG